MKRKKNKAYLTEVIVEEGTFHQNNQQGSNSFRRTLT